MKPIKLFFIALFTISCSNDDVEKNVSDLGPQIFEIKATTFYLDFLPSDKEGLKFNFEYDSNQRLTKKIGDFIPVSASSGYSGRFTNEVFTSIVYTNNIITVGKFSSSAHFTVPKETKTFTLNSSNQIEIKETPDPNLQSNYWNKKQFYKYSNNKLTEIVTTYPNMPYYPNSGDFIQTYSEKFYYDLNDNLTKTEYFELRDGIIKGTKIIRTFDDYDNSPNPFKRLKLLDEFFYRSLSKNNFRKYTEIEYEDDIQSKSIIRNNWLFNYDTSGQIILN